VALNLSKLVTDYFLQNKNEADRQKSLASTSFYPVKAKASINIKILLKF
jgi:hypothetical protein